MNNSSNENVIVNENRVNENSFSMKVCYRCRCSKPITDYAKPNTKQEYKICIACRTKSSAPSSGRGRIKDNALREFKIVVIQNKTDASDYYLDVCGFQQIRMYRARLKIQTDDTLNSNFMPMYINANGGFSNFSINQLGTEHIYNGVSQQTVIGIKNELAKKLGIYPDVNAKYHLWELYTKLKDNVVEPIDDDTEE
jgi:hypothetical protein